MKKLFFEISQNSQENTSVGVSFYKKSIFFIKKETLAQVFFREFCEISKKIFFHRTPTGDCFCLLYRNCNPTDHDPELPEASPWRH